MKWDPNMRLNAEVASQKRLVFVALNAPVLDLFGSDETYRFDCGGCGSILAIRMWPDEGRRLAFKCPTCGHLTHHDEADATTAGSGLAA